MANALASETIHNWSLIPLFIFLCSTFGKSMHLVTSNFHTYPISLCISISTIFNLHWFQQDFVLCNQSPTTAADAWFSYSFTGFFNKYSLCALQYLGYFTSIKSWRNKTNPVAEWDPALLVLQVATFLLAYTLCLLCLGILTSFYFLLLKPCSSFPPHCTTCNQHQQGPVFPIIDYYSFAALCLWPIRIMLFSLTFSTHKILAHPDHYQ